jgi:hypothetical protein
LRGQGWYVGVEGGAMIVEDTDLDFFSRTTSTFPGRDVSIDHSVGFDVD